MGSSIRTSATSQECLLIIRGELFQDCRYQKRDTIDLLRGQDLFVFMANQRKEEEMARLGKSPTGVGFVLPCCFFDETI